MRLPILFCVCFLQLTIAHTQSRKTAVSQKIKSNSIPVIGDTVRFAQGQLTVHGFRFARDQMGEGEILILDISIWNSTNQTIELSKYIDVSFQIIDSEGRIYKIPLFIFVDYDESFDEIPPQEKRRGEFVFPSPKTKKFWLLFSPPSPLGKESKPIKMLLSNPADNTNEESETLREKKDPLWGTIIPLDDLSYSISAITDARLSIEWGDFYNSGTNPDTVTKNIIVTNITGIPATGVEIYAIIPPGSTYLYKSATWTSSIKPILIRSTSASLFESGKVLQIHWKLLKDLPAYDKFSVSYKYILKE